MEEINLLELFGGIKRRINWIILFTILGGILAFIISEFFITPQYKASTIIIIGNSSNHDDSGNFKKENPQYDELILNQKLASTYSEIIKSRSIAKKVIKNLNLNFSVGTYQNKVDVKPIKDTELMSIEVIDTIPERAMDIANETADIFKKEIKDIMHIDNVNVLDEALLPENSISPKILKNSLTGAGLGMFLSLFISVFIESNDTRIKTSEQLQEKFNLPVLGVIPEIKEK